MCTADWNQVISYSRPIVKFVTTGFAKMERKYVLKAFITSNVDIVLMDQWCLPMNSTLNDTRMGSIGLKLCLHSAVPCVWCQMVSLAFCLQGFATPHGSLKNFVTIQSRGGNLGGGKVSAMWHHEMLKKLNNPISSRIFIPILLNWNTKKMYGVFLKKTFSF